MPRTIVISEPAQFRDGFSAWLGQVAHDRWSDFRVANWRAAIPLLKDKGADLIRIAERSVIGMLDSRS